MATARSSILTSAIVVGGIWGYRKLTEPLASQPAPPGHNVIRILGLEPAPAGVPSFVTAFGFVYVSLAVIATFAADTAKAMAALIAVGDLMTNGLAVFGDISTQAKGPTPSPFAGTGLLSANALAPGGALSQAATGIIAAGGAGLAGFFPKGAKVTLGRADQGRDGQTTPGGAIIAPGSGFLVRNGSDPGGFGPSYPIVHFTSGPYSGRDIYIGHTYSQLAPGQQFQTGQVLSHTGTTPVGNASTPGWFEIGYAPGGTPGAFGQPTPF